MKRSRHIPPRSPDVDREITQLRSRLTELEEMLSAIRSGGVDAVVVPHERGPKIFTLEGAGDAYRMLIESMNEGAMTLTPDAVILYANRCFAKMLRLPLEQVIGSSLRRFLSTGDFAALRSHLKGASETGSKTIVQLVPNDGTAMPVQISIRLLPAHGTKRGAVGIVVTDMTEAERSGERLRALARRVVQVQEAERGRVANDLHDNITQLLCAVIFRSQTLADKIPSQDRQLKWEAERLRDIVGTTASEVERISQELRPGILQQLGLVAAMHAAAVEFSARTGISVTINCRGSTGRFPAETELALYRILQHALKNAETHAQAHRIKVTFALRLNIACLKVKDDGLGFIPERQAGRRTGSRGVGLLEMRERAAALGGSFLTTSAPGVGTVIDVHIPFSSVVAAHSPGIRVSPIRAKTPRVVHASRARVNKRSG